MPISLFTWGRPKPDRVESYRDAGVERIVFLPPSMHTADADVDLPFLDSVMPIVEEFS